MNLQAEKAQVDRLLSNASAGSRQELSEVTALWHSDMHTLAGTFSGPRLVTHPEKRSIPTLPSMHHRKGRCKHGLRICVANPPYLTPNWQRKLKPAALERITSHHPLLASLAFS